MAWNLYEGEKFLKPLCFSNGKSQDDVVQEILKLIDEGKKIIFVHGICGTGKSAIALNIARTLGKTSIVVPGKNLQNQYKRDYEGDKYLTKVNGTGKMKISVMVGRNNFDCKFSRDNDKAIPKIKKEIDSNLGIFEISKEEKEYMNRQVDDESADRWDLPCKIEIKEKNFEKIRAYLRKNGHNINPSSFLTIKDVKRASVASVCPYWSPVLPAEYELKSPIFDGAKKRKYKGLNGIEFAFYEREKGCGFYGQFNNYIDSDVIVFNSQKYKLETVLNRKPETEVEIIDECDEFLDSFSNQRNLNLDRLQNSLSYIYSYEPIVEKMRKKINEFVMEIRTDKKIQEAINNDKIIPLSETKIWDLLKLFLENPEFLSEIDEENYMFDVEKTAKMFEDFFEETYLTFHKKENNLTIGLVTTNLAKKFREIVDKNKIIVLMSGTLHSPTVLREVFGLDNFNIVEAEIQQQGQITVQRTGMEFDCKYENFYNGVGSRAVYLKSLSKCIEISKKPTLVHVNAFSDLPSEKELSELKINNILSREKLQELQNEDKEGLMIKRFKEKQIDVLFSTKSSRGIDFPGEQCNSIIFTKYPNPNVKDAFWKILNQTRPRHYWTFYKDKAYRELLQRIYRGLRYSTDHVYVLSPDERVLRVFDN
jgi:Rad3-related DNA helicase